MAFILVITAGHHFNETNQRACRAASTLKTENDIVREYDETNLLASQASECLLFSFCSAYSENMAVGWGRSAPWLLLVVQFLSYNQSQYHLIIITTRLDFRLQNKLRV